MRTRSGSSFVVVALVFALIAAARAGDDGDGEASTGIDPSDEIPRPAP